MAQSERIFRPPPPPPKKKRVLDVEKFYAGIDYYPHRGQRKLHSHRERFKVLSCGRRWGKSTSGPHDKVIDMMKTKSTLGWIVAPTYDLGEKEFRVFWSILVDKLQVPIDRGKTFNSIRTKDFRITTAWGSSVEVRSAEHPESLVGEGLDWVIMAEAAKLKLSHWQKYIRPTLSDKRGSAIFVSTPEGYNWFYDIFQQGQNNDDFDEWWSYRSPTWENDIVFPGGEQDPEMLAVKNELSTEVFDQEYGALFTSFAGRIYSEFDEGYHIIPEHKWQFHPEWENWLTFDFGFRNPFACLNIQIDPEENIYVWDEYYERGKPTPDHARNLKSHIQWRVDGGFHDPAGPDAAASITQIFRDEVEYRNPYLVNFNMNPSNNEWKSGVERVKEWLKLRPTGNGDQVKPKLFVVSNCTNTLREFNTYRVKEESEKMMESKDPREEPRKKDDHAMDALRYFVVGKFGMQTHYAESY